MNRPRALGPQSFLLAIAGLLFAATSAFPSPQIAEAATTPVVAKDAIIAGAAFGGMGARTARADETEESLVGTWIITSTRAGSVPNGILVHVLSDGGFLRTGNTHPTESPAMGVWRQVSDAVYEVTYLALQFDNTGKFIGHRKAWLRIPLDPSGDSFTGRFRIVTLNVNGEQSAPIEGEILGTRMMVEAFA